MLHNPSSLVISFMYSSYSFKLGAFAVGMMSLNFSTFVSGA